MREQQNPVHSTQGKLRLNKRLYIFLICFLISLVFWLLIALSKDYPTSISIPVRYINMPGKKVVTNDLPAKIRVSLKASGFRILSFDFQKKRSPVVIDIANGLKKYSASGEVMSVSTQGFVNEFYKELGKRVTITGLQPASIVFNFSDRITKRLPVVLDLYLSLEKQYDTIGIVKVDPAFIDVSGPPSLMDTLSSLHTVPFNQYKVHAPIQSMVKLMTNRLLNYSVDQVKVTIPVEKVTEGITEVMVEAVNIPKGFSMKVFPDRIKVKYIVALSKYNQVNSSMFRAIVDATDLDHQHPDKVIVQLVRKPDFVRFADVESPRIDYIMHKE